VTSETFPGLRSRLAARSPRRVSPNVGQREAAVALILGPDERGAGHILFIKRAEFTGDPWSGQIAFPGGRRDPADPDLQHTAMRETLEETGISLAPDALAGALDDLSPVSPHLPQIIVRPFVFELEGLPRVEPSAEVALHLWVSRDVLQSSRTSETLMLLGQPRLVPGYRVGHHFIWGMTERILTPLLDLLDQR
jgi:8-oxo-dGTP pyrophosphatase MutT (NUDIX family)